MTKEEFMFALLSGFATLNKTDAGKVIDMLVAHGYIKQVGLFKGKSTYKTFKEFTIKGHLFKSSASHVSFIKIYIENHL